MAEIVALERVLWGLSIVLKAALVCLLLYRKNHQVFPFFFVYALLNLFHSLALFESYRVWGFSSALSFKIVWGTQSVVSVTRALAVVEVCRRVLAKYAGIWAVAWRVFLGMAIMVLVYSLAVGEHSWRLAVVIADRGFELAMAAAVLGLFLFIRCYEVAIEPTVRLLAIGFFLYSCFSVLNDTILERWLIHYITLWNVLGTVSFLATLLLWSWALRQAQPQATTAPEVLSASFYRTLAPEINSRLKALNEQLSHLAHTRKARDCKS